MRKEISHKWSQYWEERQPSLVWETQNSPHSQFSSNNIFQQTICNTTLLESHLAVSVSPLVQAGVSVFFCSHAARKDAWSSKALLAVWQWQWQLGVSVGQTGHLVYVPEMSLLYTPNEGVTYMTTYMCVNLISGTLNFIFSCDSQYYFHSNIQVTDWKNPNDCQFWRRNL